MRDVPGSGVRYPALAATADGSEAVVWVDLPAFPLEVRFAEPL
jgi:hypothetical protein